MKKDGIHKKIQRKMLLYLDHELPEKEREMVRRHLQNCSYCSRVLEYYERIWKKLSPGEKIPPSPHLWGKLQNRLAGREEAHLFSLRLKLFVRRYAYSGILTAAFSLAVAAGVIIGAPSSAPSVVSTAFNRQIVGLTEEFELDRFSIAPPGSLAGIFYETK